jgi:hypothetical protein
LTPLDYALPPKNQTRVPAPKEPVILIDAPIGTRIKVFWQGVKNQPELDKWYEGTIVSITTLVSTLALPQSADGACETRCAFAGRALARGAFPAFAFSGRGSFRGSLAFSFALCRACVRERRSRFSRPCSRKNLPEGDLGGIEVVESREAEDWCLD